MRTDLAALRTTTDVRDGTITGGDGRTYVRRSTRMPRREADALVAAGVPVILDLYGHGRLEWCDGDDAGVTWAEERAYVITSEPTTRQLAKHVMWTAGRWEAHDGTPLVYLTGRC